MSLKIRDYCCVSGHVFEAWLREEDPAKEPAECPVCGSREVTRRPSAPRRGRPSRGDRTPAGGRAKRRGRRTRLSRGRPRHGGRASREASRARRMLAPCGRGAPERGHCGRAPAENASRGGRAGAQLSLSPSPAPGVGGAPQPCCARSRRKSVQRYEPSVSIRQTCWNLTGHVSLVLTVTSTAPS